MYHHHDSSTYHLDPTTNLFSPPILGSQAPAFFTPSSSPPYSSPPSLPSSSYYYLQRSNSTHSLCLANPHPNIPEGTPQPFYSSSSHHHHHHLPPQPSSSPSSSGDFFDFYDGPVRRVFSTGDLQGMNGMPAPSGENSSQEGGGTIASKVGRYSAEERKERIEKYRSKRNQRNFHKKITYACRKTLADSRPRIRGRFARNGETETEVTEAEAAEMMMSEGYDKNTDYEGDWWRQMQAALGTTEEEDRCGYDDDLLSSYVDVFSMNLLS